MTTNAYELNRRKPTTIFERKSIVVFIDQNAHTIIERDGYWVRKR